MEHHCILDHIIMALDCIWISYWRLMTFKHKWPSGNTWWRLWHNTDEEPYGTSTCLYKSHFCLIFSLFISIQCCWNGISRDQCIYKMKWNSWQLNRMKSKHINRLTHCGIFFCCCFFANHCGIVLSCDVIDLLLAQVMAWCLLDAKPLTEPVLMCCCQLYPPEET